MWSKDYFGQHFLSVFIYIVNNYYLTYFQILLNKARQQRSLPYRWHVHRRTETFIKSIEKSFISYQDKYNHFCSFIFFYYWWPNLSTEDTAFFGQLSTNIMFVGTVVKKSSFHAVRWMMNDECMSCFFRGSLKQKNKS